MTDPFFYNIAEICAGSGLNEVVLSPGSRCAPLTIAFSRHPEIHIRTISDERSAGYIGLGIALGKNAPTGLVCTSGTAAANYMPAVAEAFYQQIPLVIFTADRPPEWIDQQDGQAIRQTNIYGNHVKGAYTLPMDLSHTDVKWHFTRIITEAIQLSKTFPAGPVHINVPFREPFYPEKDDEITFSDSLVIRNHTRAEGSIKLDPRRIEYLQETKKILIIGGQHRFNEGLTATLSSVSDKHVPVIGDIISNLHEVNNAIIHPDNYLNHVKGCREQLVPDLLITFGNSVISKSLKLFFRNNKPVEHWHIQEAGEVADPFQSITQVFHNKPLEFLWELDSVINSKDNIYQNTWLSLEKAVVTASEAFFSQLPEGEFTATWHFIKNLPVNSNLHLANSMAVRYANYIGAPKNKKLSIFSNRGTSGIDGSNSTAVGVAMTEPGKQNFLLTGDMAFLYDRNAFWHNYPLENLKVLVLNNHGGGIFRMIDGPGQLPELEELFETKQRSTAKYLAAEYGIKYFHSFGNLQDNKLQDFFDHPGGAIFEYESAGLKNHEIFNNYKSILNQVVEKL